MTEVFKENELKLIQVYLVSKGNEVNVLYDHDVPGEFRVDIDIRLTAHFHQNSDIHHESFKSSVEDILDRCGKKKMMMCLRSLCDEYPDDKLSNE